MDKDKISKKKYQDVGDAIGMPDNIDKQRIREIIDSFEKKHPGEIKLHRDEASAHVKDIKAEYGVVGKKSARRYALELPEPLHAAMEKYIPTLFRSKKHFGWLKKNFKELFVEY